MTNVVRQIPYTLYPLTYNLYPKRSAFTLVELSIVLIIIGLIVGGVLGGQSLIRSAELQRTASEFRQYSTALNAFRLEFNALPGDMDNAWDYWENTGQCVNNTEEGCNGNGDGNIGVGDGSQPTFTGSGSVAAFNHLSLAGIIPGSYTGERNTDGSAYTIGENVPKLFVTGTSFVYRNYKGHNPDNTHSLVPSGNVMQLAKISETDVMASGAFSPKEARSIDLKLDDGIPTSGKLFGQDSQLGSSSLDGQCLTPSSEPNGKTFIDGYSEQGNHLDNKNLFSATYYLSNQQGNQCFFIYSID